MALIEPSTAAEITGGQWQPEVPSCRLTRFSIDTRLLESGSTFVAVRTPKRDGADFLAEAEMKGAVAAIVERYRPNSRLPQLVVEDSISALQKLARYERERFSGWVLGITGSFGKTSVKELIGGFFDKAVYRTEGNLNNHIGLPLSLLNLSGAVHRGAVLEAGINQPGEMEILAQMLQPESAIITGVGPAHLEKLQNLEGVAHEKSVLLAGLKFGGLAIFPAELLQYNDFCGWGNRFNVYLTGKENSEWEEKARENNYSFIYYKWTRLEDAGASGTLVLNLPECSKHFHLKETSSGLLSNFAIAASFGILRHVPDETIQAALDGWKPFKQRGEILVREGQTIYLDCYNANPESMIDAAANFRRSFSKETKLYVLAGMNELGPQSEFWHEKVSSELQLDPEDKVVLVGELAETYGKGLEKSGVGGENITRVADASEARKHVQNFKGAIFIKGSRSYKLETVIAEGVC